MTTLNVYLNFNNNCREAMEFYRQCFGGELTVQTVGESPMREHSGPEILDKVMHAALQGGAVNIMAADAIGPGGYQPGTNVSLSLNCTDEAELKSYFETLSAGAHIVMPLQPTFWSPAFGMLTDKFGVQWMFNAEKK